METQNITLTLSKGILQKLEFLAAKRNVSISHLLIQALNRMFVDEIGYQEASIRQTKLMKNGIDIGFQKTANRGDLHER